MTTRPLGPVPAIRSIATPAASAIARALGLANTREPLGAARGPPRRGGWRGGRGGGGGGRRGRRRRGAADAPGVKSANSAQSFSSSTMIATSSPTLTSVAPAGTRILATCPSSIDSSAIVALSVSMSAMTSPALTLSPASTFHSDDVTLGHRRGERRHRDLLVGGLEANEQGEGVGGGEK